VACGRLESGVREIKNIENSIGGLLSYLLSGLLQAPTSSLLYAYKLSWCISMVGELMVGIGYRVG
jgi:hypothetical protein